MFSKAWLCASLSERNLKYENIKLKLNIRCKKMSVKVLLSNLDSRDEHVQGLDRAPIYHSLRQLRVHV